jgi:3-oxoacyl-[acyl-carrier protein] reductase
LRLAADGAAVAIVYRRRAADAARVVESIQEKGGRALAVEADLSAGEAAVAVETVERGLGHVDILVNNAAVFERGDLEDFDFSKMDAMRRTNVDGLVMMTRAVIAGMKERRWGRIINLTSIAATGTSLAGTTFYAATKAAVITLTRRFAMTLGPHGITVNAIAPGYVETEMVVADKSAEERATIHDALAARAMMQRVGAPEDIAHAASFLASEGAGFVTAQVLTVDGGRTDYIAHA